MDAVRQSEAARKQSGARALASHRSLITFLAAGLILAVGLSRLYLGVHYFTDVAAGYAAGAVWLLACISGIEAFRRRVGGGVRSLVLASLLAGSALPARAQPTPTDLHALPDSLEAALDRFNPEILAARAALEAARARLSAAGFAPPAVLNAEAEEIHEGWDLSRAGSLRLELERELLGGGRRAAARELAAAEVDAASAGLYSAERRVRAVAARALARTAGWSAIERRLGVEDSLLASAEESIRARFSVGQARYVDLLRVRTERLRVQTERASASAEARIARQVLEALIRPPEGAAPPPPAIPLEPLIEARAKAFPVPLSPAPDLDTVVAASGALRAADAALARARSARALALAQLRSRFSGFLGIQRFADDGRFTLGPTLGGSVSLPFTAPRATSTAVAAADREVEAAEAERGATLANLRTDLAAARERYEVARLKLGGYDAALLQGAREERESALGAYRAGDLSLLELLDFERALARAELDRLRSHIDAADALADMLTGMAGPPVSARNPRSLSSSGAEER